MHRLPLVNIIVAVRTSRSMRVKCGISLLGLALAGAGSSSSRGNGDGNNYNSTASSMSSTSSNVIIDDSHHLHRRAVEGLHWRDLGVSLANCPWTTAQMLDKCYDGDADASCDRTTMDEGRTWKMQCIDDSTWLLHPSSGYVESGSLCGILGPRYAIHRSILFALLLCLFSGETYLVCIRTISCSYGCAAALAKPPCLMPSEEQLLVAQEYF